MFTVTLFSEPAHYQRVSVLAESAASAAPPSGVLSTVAIVVVIMLLGFALKGVKPVVVTLFDLVRTLFNALGVAALLVLALVVLIGALVVSATGH
jgi:hypothetical protein